MILTDRQVTMLASGMGIVRDTPPEMARPPEMVRQMKALLPRKIRHWISGARELCVPVQPCTWNMAFRRRYGGVTAGVVEAFHLPGVAFCRCFPQIDARSFSSFEWNIGTTFTTQILMQMS